MHAPLNNWYFVKNSWRAALEWRSLSSLKVYIGEALCVWLEKDWWWMKGIICWCLLNDLIEKLSKVRPGHLHTTTSVHAELCQTISTPFRLIHYYNKKRMVRGDISGGFHTKLQQSISDVLNVDFCLLLRKFGRVNKPADALLCWNKTVTAAVRGWTELGWGSLPRMADVGHHYECSWFLFYFGT